MENPVQVVLKNHTLHPVFFNLIDLSSNEIKKRLEEVKSEDRKNKFSLQEVPFRVMLCKLQETKYKMIISYHHILFDGWSSGIILEDFFKIYCDLLLERTPSHSTKSKFKEFVKWVYQEERQDKKIFGIII